MIKINNSFSGVYYSSYDIYVHIAPYKNFGDAVKLLPHDGALSANFDPKSFSGHSAIRWGGLMHLPELNWECTLKAARQIYKFGCNSLGYLCDKLGIPEGKHHRAGDDAEMCARLFLKELKDTI